MKMYFEEPEVRVEKFAAESVMVGAEGIFGFLSGLADFDLANDRTHGIRPY